MLSNKVGLITATINEHLVMYNNEYTNTKTKYDAITADYTARNDAIYTQIGGNKHTKKKHRKSNKNKNLTKNAKCSLLLLLLHSPSSSLPLTVQSFVSFVVVPQPVKLLLHSIVSLPAFAPYPDRRMQCLL